jgi:hypothetical protein
VAKLSYKLGWRVTLLGTALDASGAKVHKSFGKCSYLIKKVKIEAEFTTDSCFSQYFFVPLHQIKTDIV